MFIKKYDDMGLRASGSFEEGLEPEVTKSSMIMWGSGHTYYMVKGRAAGKFPPKQAIEDWIDVKESLPSIFKEKKRQFAFIIARKIAQEGIQVPNAFNKGDLVDSVVDDFLGNYIDKMLNELGDVFLAQITSDVIGILREELTAA
jgi:hypothetical protein